MNQDVVLDKRMKLDYEEITPCIKESVQLWDDILRGQHEGDLNLILKTAIRQGKCFFSFSNSISTVNLINYSCLQVCHGIVEEKYGCL